MNSEKFYDEKNKHNLNGTNYGRIAYDKATENEKKIAENEKREEIDEFVTLKETETVDLLYGDVLDKGFKFEASGKIVTFEADVQLPASETTSDSTSGTTDSSSDSASATDNGTSDSSASGEETDDAATVTAEIYLNGKKIGEKSAADAFPLSCRARTKQGENVVYVTLKGVTSNTTVTLSATGQIKKAATEKRVYYIYNDYYAVKYDDTLAVFHYADSQFTRVFFVCGLKVSSACYDTKGAMVYVLGKRFSGSRFIYKVNPTTREITLIDDVLNYSTATIGYISKLRIYHVIGGLLRVSSYEYGNIQNMLPGNTYGVNDVYTAYFNKGYYLAEKRAQGYSFLRRTASGIMASTYMVPMKNYKNVQVRFNDSLTALFEIGDGKSGTCCSKIVNKNLTEIKQLYTESCVTESETRLVGLNGRVPVVIREL